MPFSSVIHEHLELRRRNATLEREMPLQQYMPADPFENHALFKTEEQARVEDTMDGLPSIVDQPTSLAWSVDQGTRRDTPAAGSTTESGEGAATDSDESSGERLLWARSREFDWGE